MDERGQVINYLREVNACRGLVFTLFVRNKKLYSDWLRNAYAYTVSRTSGGGALDREGRSFHIRPAYISACCTTILSNAHLY